MSSVSTPNELAPPASTNGTLLLRPTVNNTAKVEKVIGSFRPTKVFKREYHNAPTSILSLDFDDKGETLLTSESDESMNLYNVLTGTHSKQLLSKKYGAKLAKFSHNSSSVLYASTKVDDAIRYLSSHTLSFISYFKGHTKPVTCITMHPGEDHFISCSLDDTVRIWDLNTANAVGKLNISHPYLAAFDPSANVIAIASPSAQAILLYDYRNFDKEPFAVFDILQHGDFLGMEKIAQNWSKLQFSNDGKSLLLGTNGDGHYLLDAFNGSLKSYLSIGGDRKSSARLCAGGENTSGERKLETSGDVCFSPDGRYVLGGARKENIVVWDVHQPFQEKALKPVHELPQRSEAGVLEYNPRFNMLASADKEVVFWHPDRDAALS